MLLRATIASSATTPIVSAIPDASDTRTTTTEDQLLWTQAKPNTEIVSGQGSSPMPAIKEYAGIAASFGRTKALHDHEKPGQHDEAVADDHE
jgi:hypothetical protein